MNLPNSVEILLQEMVSINTVNASVTGNPAAEEPLAQYLHELAEQSDLRVTRLPIEGRAPNLVIQYEVSPDRPWLVFESHMDTVAVEGMVIEPFAGAIRDGRLWGRGACDTKGTGAAMFWALQQYVKSASRPNNIALAYTIDEEFGMLGVRQLVRQHLPQLGIKPVGVIVGEPTLLKPVVAHNGDVRWRVRVRGVAAHSSNPARGRSAISLALHLVQRIEADYIPSLNLHDPLTGKNQASVTLIRGGSAINIIPDQCDFSIDRRLTPGEDPDVVTAAFRSFLTEAATAAQIEFDLETLFAAPPLTRTTDSALSRAVRASLEQLNLPTDELGAGYATDAGDLSAAGIACVVIGPGDLVQAHTKDEWIALDQLNRGVELYRTLMRTPVS